MRWEVVEADVCQWDDGRRFHALLCDPPYGIDFFGLEWDKDVAFRVETWRHIMSLMLPGAFGFVFSGARTFHRVAVAMEDAGWVIHPMVGWIHVGQSMPKSQRIDLQVDRRNGGVGKVVGYWKPWGSAVPVEGRGAQWKLPVTVRKKAEQPRLLEVREAETEEGKAWSGYRYGKQVLRPVLEPILCVQKPYEGKPLDSILRYGSGALNIAGGTIGEREIVRMHWPHGEHPYKDNGTYLAQTGEREMRGQRVGIVRGAWPTNCIVDEGAKVAIEGASGYDGLERNVYVVEEGGGLFSSAAWVSKKVWPYERNVGCGEMANDHAALKPQALTSYLARLLLPPEHCAPRRLFVPFAGTGSEMIGALQAGWDEIVGVEINGRYAELAKRRIEYWCGEAEGRQ